MGGEFSRISKPSRGDSALTAHGSSITGDGSYGSGIGHHISDVAARCVAYPHSVEPCPWFNTPGHAIFARYITDPTGRVLIETKPYSITRFHHGAWIGMFILAVVLLILCALFAGLTLGVCGLDATLLQLRCVTGTPREKYEASLDVRTNHADKF
jgi:hypothetical protein